LPMHYPPQTRTAVFHHAPVAVSLAIFASLFAAQKHLPRILPNSFQTCKGGRSALQRHNETHGVRVTSLSVRPQPPGSIKRLSCEGWAKKGDRSCQKYKPQQIVSLLRKIDRSGDRQRQDDAASDP